MDKARCETCGERVYFDTTGRKLNIEGPGEHECPTEAERTADTEEASDA